MSDIIPNVVVSMPSQQFTLARKFQAASNGKIYIGKIDTDPTIPENQIQVYVQNEDDSLVPIAQPIIINTGGYPVYGGQISKFVTVEGHSMAVYDSYNVQQFYFPNVLSYDPDQFSQLLGAPDGQKYIGLCPDVPTLRTIEPTVPGQRITLREYTAGTTYGGGQLRAVLDGSAFTDNGVTIFKTTGGAAWIRINASIISPLMGGAVPVEGVDNSDAINRTFLAGKRVVFGGGVFTHKSQILIQSGASIDLSGAIIKPTDDNPNSAWLASGIDFKITGGTFEATGNRHSSTANLLQMSNCQNATVTGTTFLKSSEDGLRMLSCTNCNILNVRSNNNYGIGIQDRDGLYNSINGCIALSNGDTGLVSNDGGRGIMLWRTVGTASSDCLVGYNTEFGFRVFSASTDAVPSKNIMVSNLRCVDNAEMDVYVFNAQGLFSDIVFNNVTIERTIDPQDTCISIQGTRIRFLGGSIRKEGTRMARHAVAFFLANKCTISDFNINNLGQVVSHSQSADNQVNSFTGDCSIVGQLGVRTIYRDNYFIHAGSGVTDVAIEATAANADDSGIISGNKFEGFYRVFVWNAHKVTISGNESTGTVDVCLRMNGDGISNLVMGANRWDSASNPALLNTYQRQGYEGSARPTYYDNAAPTALTWPVGARVIRLTPAVGQPKAYTCTVAGTPGTWVSEGNL